MNCSMPAALASSIAYWISGLSTTGSISFGIALVAGRKRVPSPATGNTALRTGLGMKLLDPVGRRRQPDSCHRLLQTDKKSRGSAAAVPRRAGQERPAGFRHSEKRIVLRSAVFERACSQASSAVNARLLQCAHSGNTELDNSGACDAPLPPSKTTRVAHVRRWSLDRSEIIPDCAQLWHIQSGLSS